MYVLTMYAIVYVRPTHVSSPMARGIKPDQNPEIIKINFSILTHAVNGLLLIQNEIYDIHDYLTVHFPDTQTQYYQIYRHTWIHYQQIVP